MSNVIFKKGLEANLPANGEVNELFFAEDTGRLFKGAGTGKPLVAYSDVDSRYTDLADLQSKNPAKVGKLYLTNDAKVYIYDSVDYTEISGSSEPVAPHVPSVMAGYVNWADLATKNPAIKGKLYLTNEDKLYTYNGIEYVEVSGKAGVTPPTDGGSLDVKQVTKLNVVATPELPHTVEIAIPFTSRFDKLPVEVLRMEGTAEQVTQTLAEFDNADATDFIENEFIEFDGTMHLKTNYEFETEVVDEEEGIYSFDLSQLDKFKKIVSINVV